MLAASGPRALKSAALAVAVIADGGWGKLHLVLLTWFCNADVGIEAGMRRSSHGWPRWPRPHNPLDHETTELKGRNRPSMRGPVRAASTTFRWHVPTVSVGGSR